MSAKKRKELQICNQRFERQILLLRQLDATPHGTKNQTTLHDIRKLEIQIAAISGFLKKRDILVIKRHPTEAEALESNEAVGTKKDELKRAIESAEALHAQYMADLKQTRKLEKELDKEQQTYISLLETERKERDDYEHQRYNLEGIFAKGERALNQKQQEQLAEQGTKQIVSREITLREGVVAKLKEALKAARVVVMLPPPPHESEKEIEMRLRKEFGLQLRQIVRDLQAAHNLKITAEEDKRDKATKLLIITKGESERFAAEITALTIELNSAQNAYKEIKRIVAQFRPYSEEAADDYLVHEVKSYELLLASEEERVRKVTVIRYGMALILHNRSELEEVTFPEGFKLTILNGDDESVKLDSIRLPPGKALQINFGPTPPGSLTEKVLEAGFTIPEDAVIVIKSSKPDALKRAGSGLYHVQVPWGTMPRLS